MTKLKTMPLNRAACVGVCCNYAILVYMILMRAVQERIAMTSVYKSALFYSHSRISYPK